MYDQAIDLRDRMVALRKQFEQMQKKAEIDRQENEEKQLREAGNIIRKTRLKEWGQRQINLQHHLKAQHGNLVEVHRVQTHQLEEEMSIIPKPIIKFSTNMLAMKNSEKELVKQLRFEEAKSLRKRIDVLEAREVGSYEKRLEAADEMRRQRLQDSQAVDDKKRLQMSKKFEWSQARHKERDMMVNIPPNALPFSPPFLSTILALTHTAAAMTSTSSVCIICLLTNTASFSSCS
jgi:hypothetical protein